MPFLLIEKLKGSLYIIGEHSELRQHVPGRNVHGLRGGFKKTTKGSIQGCTTTDSGVVIVALKQFASD